MKIKSVFSLLIVILCLGCFISCDDDDDKNNGNEYSIFLPQKISLSSHLDSYSTEDKFTYDSNNRIVEVYHTNENSLEAGYRYEMQGKIKYDANNRVISWIYTREYFVDGEEKVSYSDTITYSYNGNIVTDNEDKIYEIDGNGNLQRVYFLNDEEDIISYQYDNNGNLIKATDSTDRYEYDNKNGIFKDVNTPQWFLYYNLGQMNVVRNVTAIKDTDDDCDISIDINYDMYEYPVELEKKAACSDEIISVTEITYIKK